MALCVTELLRLECRIQPLAQGDSELLALYDELFDQPGLIWQPLNREVFDLACRLRAQHRLKTPDALHLAAAATAGCDEFWTHDRRLAAAGAGLIQVSEISTDNPGREPS
jgi:predicted nucleic acid-binding protein